MTTSNGICSKVREVWGSLGQQSGHSLSRCLMGVTIVLLVSLLKSYSIWHYEHFFIDEEAVVNFAVGFLDYDFNPRWFGYHTLPMYLLYAVYHGIYYLYLALGYVSRKSEFAALLFSDDKVFFVSARLLFSAAYSTGIFVMARAMWRKFDAPLAAVTFFIVGSLFPDSLLAANWVRVDSFVFLFLALTVYFSCYTTKSSASFVLATMFASAAFCCKFPAITIPAILFCKLAADVYAKEYPKRYLAYYLLLVPAFVLAFMPFAIIDLGSYRQFLDELAARASGQHFHLGKLHLFSWRDRLPYLYKLFAEQVTVVSLLGSALYLAVARARKEQLFPFVFMIAYATPFMTSLTVDSYWYRPLYPFLIFFTFIALVMLTAKGPKVDSFIKSGIHKSLPVAIPSLLAVAVGGFYLCTFKGNAEYQLSQARNQQQDSRLASRAWINDNIRPGSRIWLEGEYVHYFPKVLAADIGTDRQLRGEYFPAGNYIMDKAFSIYYKRRAASGHAYDVGILGTGDYREKFQERLKLLRPGDYVITSSYVYDRYYKDDAMKGLDKVAEDAKAYYEVLSHQDRACDFSGKGPSITIYKIRNDFRQVL